MLPCLASDAREKQHQHERKVLHRTDRAEALASMVKGRDDRGSGHESREPTNRDVVVGKTRGGPAGTSSGPPAGIHRLGFKAA